MAGAKKGKKSPTERRSIFFFLFLFLGQQMPPPPSPAFGLERRWKKEEPEMDQRTFFPFSFQLPSWDRVTPLLTRQSFLFLPLPSFGFGPNIHQMGYCLAGTLPPKAPVLLDPTPPPAETERASSPPPSFGGAAARPPPYLLHLRNFGILLFFFLLSLGRLTSVFRCSPAVTKGRPFLSFPLSPLSCQSWPYLLNFVTTNASVAYLRQNFFPPPSAKKGLSKKKSYKRYRLSHLFLPRPKTQ